VVAAGVRPAAIAAVAAGVRPAATAAVAAEVRPAVTAAVVELAAAVEADTAVVVGVEVPAAGDNSKSKCEQK